MSTFGYKQAIKARDAAYERKGGMTVGLPKATMAADHLALFVKEYEALEQRLREEIMFSYDSLTETRKARYSGPEEYADSVLVLELEASLGEKEQESGE